MGNITTVKTLGEMIKSEAVLEQSASALGMLFPYAGLKRKAVEVYVKEIEKSDLSPETKVCLIMNAKKDFKKFQNASTIADIAVSNAKPGTDFSVSSEVDEEWLDRYMDSAGFVSSGEMQLIWGKILANEFENPGSTPPNMRRILTEITPSLANAFRCICSMSIRLLLLDENGDIYDEIPGLFVPFHNNEEVFRKLGVGFETLNELETLGVLRFSSFPSFISKGITGENILVQVGDKLELIRKYKEAEFPIGDVLLTSTGEALRAITDTFEIDGYHEMVHRYLEDKGVEFEDDHNYYVMKDSSGVIARLE